MQLRIASYNIHSGTGRDGRLSLRRIVKVIREIDPDIISLQEVGDLKNAASGRRQFQALSRLTGLQFVAGPTGPGYYGNAILSRIPARDQGQTILNYRNREPRGMVHCELFWPNAVESASPADGPPELNQGSKRSLSSRESAGGYGKSDEGSNKGYRIMVFSTHLGLNSKERWTQILRLIARIRRTQSERKGYYLLMGEFNIWWPLSSQLRYLEKRLNGFWMRDHTFPSGFPFLSLDRFLRMKGIRFLKCGRHLSPLSREASDHLPLVAEIELLPP